MCMQSILYIDSSIWQGMQTSHLASRRNDCTDRYVTFGHLTHARFLEVVSEVQPAVLFTNENREDSGCNRAVKGISAPHVTLPRCHLAGGDTERIKMKPCMWVLVCCESQQLSLLAEVWIAVWCVHIHVPRKTASQSSHFTSIIVPCVHRPIGCMCTACFRVQFILDIYCNALMNTYTYLLFLIESRSTLCEMFHNLLAYYSSELYHKCLISLLFDISFLNLDFRTNIYN